MWDIAVLDVRVIAVAIADATFFIQVADQKFSQWAEDTETGRENDLFLLNHFSISCYLLIRKYIILLRV